MLRVGERIGPLSIERPIGAGGMGEVYLARDERLERLVAIKLLPASRGVDAGAHARLLREARSLSALKHPGIVTIHDIGTHHGLSYIVMEYVDGETFDELVRRRGPLPAAEAVDIIGRVGDAVAAAHDAGVLHRDLKSANLMMEEGGRVKVLDFGLSKRTDVSVPPNSRPPSRRSEPVVNELADAPTVASGLEIDATTPAPIESAPPANISTDATTPAPSGGSASGEPQTVHGAGMGTPGFAPPELFAGLAADARSDVFSLACVFYHLLTGAPPFPGATWATQRELIEAGAKPPSKTIATNAFDAVMASALDPDPERRPKDVRALIVALRAALGPPQASKTRIAMIGAAFGVAAIGSGALVIAKLSSSNTTAPAHVVDAAPRPPLVPTQLTTTGGCAYSPAFLDDTTLTFDLTKDGAVDLYRLDLSPGAKPVRITTDDGWEWRSAKGAAPHETVFLVQGKGFGALDALDVVTGKRRRLIDQVGPVVGAGDDYFYAPMNAAAIRRIHAGNDEPFVSLPADIQADTMFASPDGKRIGVLLFDLRQLPQICTTELAQPKLACTEVSAASGRPAFSSDGNAIYYEGLLETGIMRVALSGGQPTDVVPKARAVGGLTVSPHGGTLVFSTCTARSELVSVIDDPNKPITDDESASAPTFGAGSALAFIRGGRPDPAIVVRTPDGRTREHYKHMGVVLSQLAFDHDGDTLVFVLNNRDAPGIYLTRLNSSAAPNRLTENPKDRRPIFVGDEIVFTRIGADSAPHLMRIGVDGSNVREASKRPRETVAAGGGRVLLASPAYDFFYWWDPKTGKETPAPKPPGKTTPMDIALSPDGNWMMWVAGTSGDEVWRARTTGSQPPELVYKLPGDRNALNGAIDDRGHPVVSVNTWSGELWSVPARDGERW